MSAYYLSANRGKRSIAIDIATRRRRGAGAAARRARRRAARELQGRPARQVRARPREPAALNPRLIYCSITGFGQDGPYAPAAGYDFAIQATGGLMSVTGEKDGTPGAEPQKVGVAVADLFTGVYATTAILAALQERHRSGRGRSSTSRCSTCRWRCWPTRPATTWSAARRPSAWATRTQHRALPGVRDAGRPHRAGDRQRRPVRALLQAGRPRRGGHATRASRPTRAHRTPRAR